MKILALCDSPTTTSGFACVAKALFPRWLAQAKAEGVPLLIDVWGIGYNGAPHDLPYRIWPANRENSLWYNQTNLNQFLDLLQDEARGYTHLFIMQDHFALTLLPDFPKVLRQICEKQGIRFIYYFPVDAPVEPSWCEIMRAAEVPVAYTHYGKAEVERKAGARGGSKLNCAVLPHGVETGQYFPLPLEARRQQRDKSYFNKATNKPWLAPEDFVVLNVNQNQRRKDIPRTLEIFARFRELVPQSKLILHMSRVSGDGLDLEVCARQFGLEMSRDFVHHDAYFQQGMGGMPVEAMRAMYNAADCYLTTSLGEGWGLGITEALACGLPCAIPDHTSCGEIYRRIAIDESFPRLFAFNTERHSVCLSGDNSRARYRSDVDSAVHVLLRIHEEQIYLHRPELPPSVKEWLSWDRIALEFWALLLGEEWQRARRPLQTPAEVGA